jgi:hypothetical protein
MYSGGSGEERKGGLKLEKSAVNKIILDRFSGSGNGELK